MLFSYSEPSMGLHYCIRGQALKWLPGQADVEDEEEPAGPQEQTEKEGTAATRFQHLPTWKATSCYVFRAKTEL